MNKSEMRLKRALNFNRFNLSITPVDKGVELGAVNLKIVVIFRNTDSKLGGNVTREDIIRVSSFESEFERVMDYAKEFIKNEINRIQEGNDESKERKI